jgi:plastocyanin
MANFSSSSKRPANVRRLAVLSAITFGASLAILLTIGGIRYHAADAAEEPVILIDNYQFSPSSQTVPAGTTVTWINKDSDVHTVTADGTPPPFKSPGLDTDDKFAFTFTNAGTYSYHCSLHPHMTGKIIVQ